MYEKLHLLGSVVEGSLDGLTVRLAPEISVEDMRVGKFLVVQGVKTKFFCMLTNVSLGTSDDRISLNPPAFEDFFMREVLAGSSTFGLLDVSPMLMLVNTNSYNSFQENINNNIELLPVKTIPSHFSQVFEASEIDFYTVFGSENDPTRCNFNIGQPLDMDIPICIDLHRFVERSNGVFGKSGTGKSFLTRLLISGVIHRQAAVNLMFDMHSEYGWAAMQEGGGVRMVKGLKQLFPEQVEIYTLDKESTNRRGVSHARELYLSYDQIDIEDLRLIAFELGLSEASLDNANILANEFGQHWIQDLLNLTNEEIREFCQSRQGNFSSITALQRKLKRLESLKYIKHRCKHNYIDEVLQFLNAGKNVVIEFGTQSNMLSYMLATNMITRRIHKSYVEKAEKFLQTKNPCDRPQQLVITIEEAHRFLDSKIVHQTIFGTIAREMRKYYVTLLVVDQRPSGIDNEIMSQIGTRITCLLNDDKDIDAIFTGVSGAGNLRSVLAKLDSKQQALVLGHAIPMPVVIRTRPYDQDFYHTLGVKDWSTISNEELFTEAEQAKSDLGF
jgi:DNA helicase HerA-like ATPase